MGLALGQPARADPVIVWGRSAVPHISVGASQTAALEVDLDACARLDVPIVRRPLGGGTVWVDAEQLCCFIILPRGVAPRRPAILFEHALEPIVRAMQCLGLKARRMGQQDIWVGNRKIQGSGAATIGSAAVLGTSFLRRFDSQRFADLVRCPSDGFRQWLTAELAAGMTDWEREGVAIAEEALRAAVTDALAARHGWRVEPGAISSDERRCIECSHEELSGPPDLGDRRLVRDGIKINQETFLLERSHGGMLLRLVVHGDRIRRVYCSRTDLQSRMEHVVGEPLDLHRFVTVLETAGLPRPQADGLANTLIDMCSDIGS